MSSSSDPMTERLLCSICLDVFSDPVSTPCGHNFCKICLSSYWHNSQDCRCPNCNKAFKQSPDLKINTTLRDVVDEHKTKSEVVCDFCTEGKLKAVKSCLVCQSSYCETHLESHLRVSGLQKHKLIDPVKNLQDYICQKHDRPLELFCRDDHTCVCLFCIEGDHKNHNTVPLEEENKERKIQMLKTQTDVQQMIENRTKKIQDIKQSADLRRSKLLEMMEKQKAAEKHDEDAIRDLEQEITELKKRNIELEQILHVKDHLHFLQEKHLRNWRCPKKSSSALHLISLLFGGIRSHLWFLVPVGISLLLMVHFSNSDKLGNVAEVKLKWMQQYVVDVTLDPDTAHPKLILSDDKKQVRHGDIYHYIPNNQKRFYQRSCVLGMEGFSSGRFYYEVQVKGKTDWTLGVVRESVNRKGIISLTPVNGFWTLALRNDKEYKARAGPSVSLSLSVKPQKVGVFVDYEEGLVSFYDVENRSHIYTYTDQSFTEKLYPYFNPCLNDEGKNSEPLIITPLNRNQ